MPISEDTATACMEVYVHRSDATDFFNPRNGILPLPSSILFLFCLFVFFAQDGEVVFCGSDSQNVDGCPLVGREGPAGGPWEVMKNN